jgi:hypothetical protein
LKICLLAKLAGKWGLVGGWLLRFWSGIRCIMICPSASSVDRFACLPKWLDALKILDKEAVTSYLAEFSISKSSN